MKNITPKSNFSLILLTAFILIHTFGLDCSAQIVGSVDTPGRANDVYVVGNYAYVADESAGLQVIDISSPTRPMIVATVGTRCSAKGVHVAGNYGYFTDSCSGLQVIDVTNPTSPTIVATVHTPFMAHGVYVTGNYAYVADSSGLKVIDISTPTRARLVADINTFGDAKEPRNPKKPYPLFRHK